MSKWMAIAAYTVGTPYEEEVKVLEASLKKYNVPYKLYPCKNRGSWANNCEHNAVVIQRAFRELNRNLVWLDSDAELFAYPTLFNSYEYDIGLFRRMHTPEQRDELGTTHHWDTGTMFMKNKPDVIEVMLSSLLPSDPLANDGDGWMMETFRRTMESLVAGKMKQKLRIGTLPVTYSYVFDTKQPEELKYKRKVVIRHNQASRRFKDEI